MSLKWNVKLKIIWTPKLWGSGHVQPAWLIPAVPWTMTDTIHSERGLPRDKRSLWHTEQQETLATPLSDEPQETASPNTYSSAASKALSTELQKALPGRDRNPAKCWSLLVFFLVLQTNRESILGILGSHSALFRKLTTCFFLCSLFAQGPFSRQLICILTLVHTDTHTQTPTCRRTVDLFLPPFCPSCGEYLF